MKNFDEFVMEIPKYILIFIITFGSILLAVALTSLLYFSIQILRDNSVTKKENPFTRVGSITTKNGVAGEIFKVEGTSCYVLVQVSMPEMGRNYMQLECK